jgi:hypothetical protein
VGEKALDIGRRFEVRRGFLLACDFLAEREQDHKDRLVNYEPKPPNVINGRRTA